MHVTNREIVVLKHQTLVLEIRLPIKIQMKNNLNKIKFLTISFVTQEVMANFETIPPYQSQVSINDEQKKFISHFDPIISESLTLAIKGINRCIQTSYVNLLQCNTEDHFFVTLQDVMKSNNCNNIPSIVYSFDQLIKDSNYRERTHIRFNSQIKYANIQEDVAVSNRWKTKKISQKFAKWISYTRPVLFSHSLFPKIMDQIHVLAEMIVKAYACKYNFMSCDLLLNHLYILFYNKVCLYNV